MGKPRDFAGKLLENIKRAEEWKNNEGECWWESI